MKALVILAAGESNRLGQPKQNLVFRDKTLLQNAIEIALKTECSPVFVVLGANEAVIRPTLNYPLVQIINNPEWQEGMASSIRAAVHVIREIKDIEGMVIMLCDQPFVTPQIINNLLRKCEETGKSIVACSYDGSSGVPALFSSLLFSRLSLLTGQQGAKKIIDTYLQDVSTVPFEKGSIDIDTVTDYEHLQMLK